MIFYFFFKIFWVKTFFYFIKGNILDDEELIETLDDSKKTSIAIQERVAEAVIIEIQINETRAEYKPVAIRGAIIYFVIADLALGK